MTQGFVSLKQTDSLLASIRALVRAAGRSSCLVAGAKAFFLPVHDPRLFACPIHDGCTDLEQMMAIENDLDLLELGLGDRAVEQLTRQQVDAQKLTDEFVRVLFNRTAQGLTGAKRRMLTTCWRHLIEIERVLLDDGPGAYMTADGIVVWPVDGYGLNAIYYADNYSEADRIILPDQIRHWTAMRNLDERGLQRLERALQQMIQHREIHSFVDRTPPRPPRA